MRPTRSALVDRALSGLLLAALVTPLGCVLPSDAGDLDYPTYGGAWQRTRRDGGRVGSIFDPGGGSTAAMSPRSELRMEESARSPGEGILSMPAEPPRDGSQPRDEFAPDAPSSPLDRDRLRSLELDEIGIELGNPAPPDLL